jgi:ABC-type multidrug transport system fused ATPase/permease subunit
VLGYIVLALFITSIVRNNLLYQNVLSASENLHNKIIYKLARTHTRFYDENTSGKIMGRCSKDIAMMDDFLSWMFTDMVQAVFLAFGSMIAMIIGNYWLCLVIIPAVILLVIITRAGIKPARQAHRLILSSKAPIFSHLSLITTGLYSVRGFGMIEMFKKRFYELAETTNRFYSAHFAIN